MFSIRIRNREEYAVIKILKRNIRMFISGRINFLRSLKTLSSQNSMISRINDQTRSQEFHALMKLNSSILLILSLSADNKKTRRL